MTEIQNALLSGMFFCYGNKYGRDAVTIMVVFIGLLSAGKRALDPELIKLTPK